MPSPIPDTRAQPHPHAARRSRRAGNTALLLLAAVLALAGLMGAVGFFTLRGGDGQRMPTLVHVVDRGPFVHEVVERGEVQSSQNVEIRCEVESRNSAGTAILEVIPEGTEVAPGEVLVRLDASAFEQERVQQQILVATSEAAMIQARNAYEAAVMAHTEYLEGTYEQERQLIEQEIFQAEEDLRRARRYAEYSRQLAVKGYVTELQLEGDLFAVDQAQKALDAGKTKLRVLDEYTKLKMIKDLESQIASTKAQWKAAESTYQLELDRLHDIEEQIEKCTIRAPQSGQVVYANDQNRRGETEFLVEPGAMVREQQVIIRLPDPRFMQVEAEINEARVTLVKPGMPVRIRLDAFPDQRLRGEVKRVNKYPERTGWWSSQVKKYATFIEIHNPPPNLRPGLTAEVRIEVERLSDVLQVPVQAVHEHGGQLYCMAYRNEGWQARQIERGSSNDKFLVVLSGLEEGVRLAMNPPAVLSYVKLPKLPPELKNAQEDLPAEPAEPGGSESELAEARADAGQAGGQQAAEAGQKVPASSSSASSDAGGGGP